jgi:hypothetical protein
VPVRRELLIEAVVELRYRVGVDVQKGRAF